mmetsp:Transcript_9056/g.20456  ORF Transcript_9056/g.20456 Transcript_9056/m.20456 type:complete len:202 (-) Transcript_9056:193-798(-)
MHAPEHQNHILNATMKWKRNSPELRRSPRLTPPPRRSPRIKEQNERVEDSPLVSIEQCTVATGTANENGGSVLSRRSPGNRNTIHTKSPRRAMVATPRKRTTPKSSTSSSKKVLFGRNIRIQNFNGEDPPIRVKRSSVKRLFSTSSEESHENGSKRIRNEGIVTMSVTQNARLGHSKSMSVVLVAVVALVAAVLGKFVMKW